MLTDTQAQAILAWHKEVLAWKARRNETKTLRQIADEMGVSRAAVSRVIAQGGEFKQPSPEELSGEISRRKRRMKHLRERGYL